MWDWEVCAKPRLCRKNKFCSGRGGSLRPPEQSTVIKQLVSVRKTIILFYAVTNYKIRLSCGRAQRPAPTGFSRILIVFAAEKVYERSVFIKSSCPASDI